ncbi:MAG: hypothetical protein U0176_10090 [Bacteroidia bacterium]
MGNSLPISVANVYPSYNWSTGRSRKASPPPPQGTFAVTVTIGNGCTNDTIVVGVDTLPLPSLLPPCPVSRRANAPVLAWC